MTEKSYALLQKVCEQVIFVPTTTRTIEQYQRIDLGVGTPSYALTCNGGVLLVDGKEDETWYQESLALIADCKEELVKAEQYLQKDVYLDFEIRSIKELFLFTKSKEPERTVEALCQVLDLEKVDVFHNGVKVYVLPHTLTKGNAVVRFQKKVEAEGILAAGDSEFDVSMLQVADIAMAPESLAGQYSFGENVVVMKEDALFSDKLLTYILEKLNTPID